MPPGRRGQRGEFGSYATPSRVDQLERRMEVHEEVTAERLRAFERRVEEAERMAVALVRAVMSAGVAFLREHDAGPRKEPGQ